jgi:hypothetical protein
LLGEKVMVACSIWPAIMLNCCGEEETKKSAVGPPEVMVNVPGKDVTE